jgi:ribonucleases P/MRP protein subunit RPP40
MKSRSTASNLSEFVHYVNQGINAGAQIDVLYTDYSAAFDRLKHHIVVEKLHSFNLPANLINWIESYLTNRTQFVRHCNNTSDDFHVTSGVPQGSHLGPTLFLLFINDIANQMDNVHISLYADDVKIAKIIKSNDDAMQLQSAIDNLKSWCDKNCLHLNLDKCAVMTISKKRNIQHTNYTYGDHTFKRVSEFRDLGVIVDEKFSFSKHIESIVAKSYAALGFVKRFCYDITDTQTLKSLYYALVQSHLEYCSVVWLPFYEVHKKKIESIQKQFTMFACREYPSEANNFRITPYDQRLAKLGMSSLQRRRINCSLTFLRDIINDNMNCPSMKQDLSMGSSDLNLRRTECVKIIDKQMRLSTTTPIHQFCKFANKIPEAFSTGINRNQFISLVRKSSDKTFGL